MKASVLTHLAVPAVLALAAAACEQQTELVTAPHSTRDVAPSLTIVAGDLVLSSAADVDGAGDITHVQGNLLIQGTDISHLGPLSSLASVGGDLVVNSNPNLGDCAGLYPLLVSGSVGGAITVGPNNAAGCNSVDEILTNAPPELRIEVLLTAVAALLQSGDLNRGQANSLASKLDNALAKLEAGQIVAAISLLQAFIHHVTDLIATGVIGDLDGQPLIDQGNAVIQYLAANAPPTAVLDWDCPLSLPVTCEFTAGGSSDSDGRITSYQWDFDDGTTGSGVTVTHVFTDQGVYVVTLTVTDDVGAMDTDTFRFQIFDQGLNELPTSNAGPNQTVTDDDGSGDEQVTLNGSQSSDPDGSIANYVWSWSGGGSAASVSPTVTLPAGITIITLTVTDNDGGTDTDQVVITVLSNEAPIANAGPDQTLTDDDGSGDETVTLDGSGSSDPDGSIASYDWSWSGGATVGVSPTITLPVGTTLVTLTVRDDEGATSTDEVEITIMDNQPPQANAGPDQMLVDVDGSGDEEVILDGSGSSDPDGSIESHVWSWPGALALGESPTVTLPVGTTIITLTVTDDEGATSTDEVEITITDNQPPQANAGADQTLADVDGSGDEEVILDGSGSNDPDGSIASYDWSWSGGAAVGVSPSVTLPVGTTLVTLTVTDDEGATSTDEVEITITDNQPPQASAGADQTLADVDGSGDETVTLDGSGSSDSDGSIVTYGWSWAGGSAMGVSPTVTLPVGTTIVTLTVTDDDGATDADVVEITITIADDDTPPQPPCNSCGDVHMRTPDGLGYDFQGAGEYLLVASTDGSVVVQVRMEPWLNSMVASVNTAVAMRVSGDRVGVYLGRSPELYVNGQPTDMTETTLDLANGGRIHRLDPHEYVVEWPNGFVTGVTLHGSYLDVGVSRPSDLQISLAGLVGNLNGQAADDVQTRGGATLGSPVVFDELYRTFGDSWRISAGESLIDYEPGTSTDTFQLLDFPVGLVSTADFDQTLVDAARQSCLAAGIQDPTLLDGCILDLVVTGEQEFVQSGVDAEPPTTSVRVVEVVNGGFDLDADGWTWENIDGQGGWFSAGGNPGGHFALNQAGELATDPKVCQVVAGIEVGQSFRITGDYASYAPAFGDPAKPDAFAVTVNGAVVLALPRPAPVSTDWTAFSTDVITGVNDPTICLVAERDGDDSSFFVDNIALKGK